jgi:hypothetical protein
MHYFNVLIQIDESISALSLKTALFTSGATVSYMRARLKQQPIFIAWLA